MGVKFGNEFRVARTTRRIPIARVAQELEHSIAYLSDIERGNRNPPDEEKVRRWAEMVGLDPDEMAQLAALDRRKVELNVENQREDKRNLALVLARSWDEMSPEQERKLLGAARKILG